LQPGLSAVVGIQKDGLNLNETDKTVLGQALVPGKQFAAQPFIETKK